MNRNQRRAKAKEARQETYVMTKQERNDIVMRAQKAAWENIMPIFLLYLVDHFHCKERGIQKFMDWFREMDDWCEGDKERLKQLLNEVSERAGVIIEYVPYS